MRSGIHARNAGGQYIFDVGQSSYFDDVADRRTVAYKNLTRDICVLD